jgi:hypothetical protein
MFDQPKADKCLLASGELDVHSSSLFSYPPSTFHLQPSAFSLPPSLQHINILFLAHVLEHLWPDSDTHLSYMGLFEQEHEGP